MTLVIDTIPAAAPAAPPVSLPSLVGLDREKLGRALAAVGVAERDLRMRVNQLWHWIYLRGALDFDEMTNVSKHLRATLAQAYSLARPQIVVEQVSQDGTRKWLLRLPADTPGEKPHEVECVYIPESDRGTLCVSSQVGCTLNCSFCHTGTQRLVRNLSAAEIVAQVMVARDRLGDYPGRDRAIGPGLPTEGDRLVTNIVFMGMEVAPMLAISLHAVRDDLRDVLVPINKKYPLAQLLEACRTYPAASNAKRITFEYVMLKGVNDSPADARALVRLLEGIPAKINLIPFNPWPGTQYECSDWETIEKFSDIVFRAGYASPVRTPRGRDILAACGQLKSETEKLSARERLALRAMAAAAE
ncbi:MAG: 23S rRNA (adenine(2503)-C(2))-methyltransferase RlmN [Rhizobiales bacterium 32-66-11]|nr:MAG: 23S rRNA (adenine(2503)-C(2))-methyltransferase RlmN [Rhizobiales bacterium 32-66-11]